MNKLLLALLAMFLVLGLAYAQTPTPCGEVVEGCADWQTCTADKCEANKCTGEETTSPCGAAGFCKKANAEEDGECEAIATCEKWKSYKAADNTCEEIECETTADCNKEDNVGFCQGATKTPAVKGKCVQVTECPTWQDYKADDNTCEDIECENNTDDTCGAEGFCLKNDEAKENDPYGKCISNVCADKDCGEEGFCKKAAADDDGVCEPVVTCPTWQSYKAADNTCDDITCTVAGKECTTAPVVGFCDAKTLKCVEVKECPTWQDYKADDNTCGDRECDKTADCNVDKNTGGFCEGADATKTPAVKGKCVAECVNTDCVKGSKCSAETNQCTPTKCEKDADCETGSECDEKQCVPLKVELKLIGAKFSRSRADGADATFDALAKLFFDTLNDEDSKCKPFNALLSPVAYAKNTIGYYVPATCDDDAREAVETVLNPVEPVDDKFIALADADVTATVELKSVGHFAESCTVPTFVCGTEVCNFACGITTPCTEANAKLVCGDHQKCVIADDAETGACANSAAMYSTLVAIVLAVAAIVF